MSEVDQKYDFNVQVDAFYVEEESNPSESQYMFAYRIRIQNTGSVAAQLVSRHWVITDGYQQIQEVRGLGVVGQQPLLKPGEAFEYISGCPLEAPYGSMRGTYQCVAEDGTHFEAHIPEFALASSARVLH